MQKLLILIIWIISFQVHAYTQDDQSKKIVLELIKKLSDDDSATREESTKSLLPYSYQYKELFQKIIKNTDDLETIERLEFILKDSEIKRAQQATDLAYEAKKLIEEKRFDEASKSIMKSIQIQKFSSVSIDVFLELNQHLGKYKENISYLNDLIQKIEKDNDYLIEINYDLESLYKITVENCLDDMDYTGALKYCEKFCTLSRFKTDALKLKAQVFEISGNINDAEKILLEAVKNEPDHTENIQMLINFNIRNKKAFQEPLKALLKISSNADNLYNSINLYYNDQVDDALKVIDQDFVSEALSALQNKTFTSDSIFDQKYYFLMFYLFMQNEKGLKVNESLKNIYRSLSEGDKKSWVSRILAVYSNDITEAQLLLEAKTNSVKETKEHLCEAYFYIGLNQIINNNKTQAKQSLEKCLENNVREFIEPTIAAFILQSRFSDK